MLGDAWDMVVLLGTAEECFIDNPAAANAVDPAPSQAIVADLVLASWELLAAFVSTDRAYRKAHNLTTDPANQRRVSAPMLSNLCIADVSLALGTVASSSPGGALGSDPKTSHQSFGHGGPISRPVWLGPVAGVEFASSGGG